MPRNTQDLFPDPCSGIIPGGTLKIIEILGIEPRLVACRESMLLVVSLQSTFPDFWTSWQVQQQFWSIIVSILTRRSTEQTQMGIEGAVDMVDSVDDSLDEQGTRGENRSDKNIFLTQSSSYRQELNREAPVTRT